VKVSEVKKNLSTPANEEDNREVKQLLKRLKIL
jgi:hypothetical protein